MIPAKTLAVEPLVVRAGAEPYAAIPPTSWRVRVAGFWQLTKPGITRMVLLTTAAGYYLASQDGVRLVTLVHHLIGIGLAASGSLSLNQYLERDADRLMLRTARRPLPAGTVRPVEALVFGTVLSVLGVIQLLLFVNVLTAALVALSLLSYIYVYTPLKRRTWLATPVGALPGALPVLAGWTAAGGTLDARGLTLFSILFLWQMPHFFALAWLYREDFLRGGFRLLTADDPDGVRTVRQVLLYTLALLAVSLLPSRFGLAGPLYLAGAVAAGLGFLALGVRLARQRSDRRALQLFLGSVVYLPVLLILMAVNKLPV